jgi:hypothetical protein
MIYILSGNDTKKKNIYLKRLIKDNPPIYIPEADLNKEKFIEYSLSINLFGDSPVVVVENVLGGGEVNLDKDDLVALESSSTTFVFMEDKLLASEAKKYKKYAIIEDFSSPITKKTPKMDVFSIAEAFSSKDKIATWTLYRDAISLGSTPEEISGIIFWKTKMMILNGSKAFNPLELKKISSELVSLYHRSHRGEGDFVIGLEQFILNSLSK